MDWVEIQSKLGIEEFLIESETSTIALFKHSTSCGISKMVLRNFEREVDVLDLKDVKFYFLDLIAYRDVSNAIAASLNVNHESPQLIIIKHAKVLSHSSHSNISAQDILEHQS